MTPQRTKAQIMSFASPEELHPTFARALESQDVAALLDLYEPSAITVLPDGNQLTDTDARREMFAGLVAAGANMQGTQRKLLVAGDIALTSTTHEMQAEGAGGPATAVETAEVSRRQPDGTWRVVIDAPNFSSSALTPPEPSASDAAPVPPTDPRST